MCVSGGQGGGVQLVNWIMRLAGKITAKQKGVPNGKDFYHLHTSSDTVFFSEKKTQQNQLLIHSSWSAISFLHNVNETWRRRASR